MISCPACGHQISQSRQEAGRRICVDCGKVVGKRHKWRIGSDGLIHHRDCQNPTAIRKDEAELFA